jgi:Outer membrane lipoprotein-sorting protein
MKKLLSISLFFLFAIALQAQTAEEIVAKHIAAMGGANWEKVKTLQMDIKMTAQAAAGMEIPIKMTVVNKKAMRMDVSLMGMTQTMCVNGDAGWANSPFQGKMDAEPMTADQAKDMKEQTEVAGQLYNYKEKGYTIEYLGKEDVEGTECYKIKLVISPTKTQYSLIDPETFYEIKNITVSMVDGKEQKMESVSSDFKTIEGLVFAHTINQSNPMMGPTVMTVNNVTINPPVDNAVFEMPAKK